MSNELSQVYSEYDIITYRRIRSAIGTLGMGLPIVLLTLPVIPFFKTSVQESISHYYYTNLRELFTGVLCAVGLFLIRYKGHKNTQWWKNDSLLTNIAGAAAFGIALFPTNPHDCSEKIYTVVPCCLPFLGALHYLFAGIFFVVLAIVSIHVFTIGQRENAHIPLSIFNENKIYKTCGYLMILCILLVPICASLHVSYSTIICETVALFLFGTSWLIKGRALGDKGRIGEKVYREQNL